jgi:hypothetical protein
MAIAKMDAYRDYLRRYAVKHPGDRRWLSRLWLWFIGWLIGYSYQPWRVRYPILAALVIGCGVFYGAYHFDYMVPAKGRIYLDGCYNRSCYWWTVPQRAWTDTTDKVLRVPDEFPEFNSLFYAIDTFFPIVDLHQEAYWSPRSDGFAGGFFRGFLWLYIISGWVLTTMAVVGFTGIIKKD